MIKRYRVKRKSRKSKLFNLLNNFCVRAAKRELNDNLFTSEELEVAEVEAGFTPVEFPVVNILTERFSPTAKTHIEESTQLRHKTSPHMESSRPKEKRKTKEHITPRNGNRHEMDEQELDGIRKGGPRQSGLENAGRRPMLHWD
ncbi:unnamed protein product [Schistosoma margrebowiei]|uniref:Uncharacterized protein n=1 Tax=Schistosoma margrebowiei TaxID=48269 RepID=A0A183MMT5_9TREM|nr:unnamed protein product [Schistosoma margrebowiei]